MRVASAIGSPSPMCDASLAACRPRAHHGAEVLELGCHGTQEEEGRPPGHGDQSSKPTYGQWQTLYTNSKIRIIVPYLIGTLLTCLQVPPVLSGKLRLRQLQSSGPAEEQVVAGDDMDLADEDDGNRNDPQAAAGGSGAYGGGSGAYGSAPETGGGRGSRSTINQKKEAARIKALKAAAALAAPASKKKPRIT